MGIGLGFGLGLAPVTCRGRGQETRSPAMVQHLLDRKGRRRGGGGRCRHTALERLGAPLPVPLDITPAAPVPLGITPPAPLLPVCTRGSQAPPAVEGSG